MSLDVSGNSRVYTMVTYGAAPAYLQTSRRESYAKRLGPKEPVDDPLMIAPVIVRAGLSGMSASSISGCPGKEPV